jgi:flagellin-like hook-associated protein FlgL
MTSINTNTSAQAALQTLRNVNQGLNTTQNHVSTGYRVGKASDNAAYWSIATTMRSDNKALGAVSDALGLGAAKVDTAYTAMDSSSVGNVMFGMSGGQVETSTGILGTSYGPTGSVYGLDITSMTLGDLGNALTTVENALKAMTSAGAKLGSISTRINMQDDFVNSLSKSLDSGIGRLVDANMEEESSRLSALQTQQQLAIQSLSIANSSSQNILSLFR